MPQKHHLFIKPYWVTPPRLSPRSKHVAFFAPDPISGELWKKKVDERPRDRGAKKQIRARNKNATGSRLPKKTVKSKITRIIQQTSSSYAGDPEKKFAKKDPPRHLGNYICY